MERHRSGVWGSRLGLPGLWLALLAIASQIGLAAAPIRSDAAAASGAAAVICHAGPPAPADRAPAHPAHDPCALCPLCAAIGAPAAVLAAGPAVLPPRGAGVPIARPFAPPSAIPVRAVAFAQPRGPPVSV